MTAQLCSGFRMNSCFSESRIGHQPADGTQYLDVIRDGIRRGKHQNDELDWFAVIGLEINRLGWNAHGNHQLVDGRASTMRNSEAFTDPRRSPARCVVASSRESRESRGRAPDRRPTRGALAREPARVVTARRATATASVRGRFARDDDDDDARGATAR